MRLNPKTCIWSPKHAFWTHQLQVPQNVDLSFYFFRKGIKRSHSADDSSNRCFECSKMLLFEPMCESSHCRCEEWSVFDVGFPDFLEDNWQTNGCVPLRIDCSALFLWYDCDMSSFSEKTGDHLLGSDSCASNFCWIWLILRDPYSRVLFTFGLIRVNPLFITCHDVIDVFQSTAIVFLEHFLRPICTSDWQIVWDPTRTNFFDS